VVVKKYKKWSNPEMITKEVMFELVPDDVGSELFSFSSEGQSEIFITWAANCPSFKGELRLLKEELTETKKGLEVLKDLQEVFFSSEKIDPNATPQCDEICAREGAYKATADWIDLAVKLEKKLSLSMNLLELEKQKLKIARRGLLSVHEDELAKSRSSTTFAGSVLEEIQQVGE
jgi:hypothetical protein